MNQKIIQDLFRYTGQDYSIFSLVKAFRTQGFRYSYFLRKCKASENNRFLFLWYKIWLSYYGIKYGFQISPMTEIGGGLYIGHFGTLIVSVHAKIGENCNLSPGVTIGRDHRGARKGSPTLGNSVWVGTNSVIVGKIDIGDNVLIAPNSFVNMDVPSHSIVIGNPAKIISRVDATEGYINNRIQ